LIIGLSQICSIDFGGGHGATFCLVEGLGYSKFPKSIYVAEMMPFFCYSKDRTIANFGKSFQRREWRLFLIFEEQDHHAFSDLISEVEAI